MAAEVESGEQPGGSAVASADVATQVVFAILPDNSQGKSLYTSLYDACVATHSQLQCLTHEQVGQKLL